MLYILQFCKFLYFVNDQLKLLFEMQFSIEMSTFGETQFYFHRKNLCVVNISGKVTFAECLVLLI